MKRAALALLLAAAAAGAAAQAPRTEVELGVTREKLSGGRADWKSVYLDAVHDFGDRRTLYGEVRETERFGLRDQEGRLGYYHPLGETWTALLEGSASGEHHVLPKYSLFGQLAKQLGDGWGVNAGVRRSDYNATSADLLVLGAERYWGNWRGAYTLYSGRPEGAGSAAAHRFQLNYYYAERSTIGVAATFGREVENVGPPTGLVTTDVRALSVTGRHWLTPQWGFSWEVLAVNQGDLYRRRGALLGIRYRF